MLNVIQIPSTAPVRFDYEELDLIIHAAWIARQHALSEKYHASDEGDYKTVGEMEDAAKRLQGLIDKIKSAKQ